MGGFQAILVAALAASSSALVLGPATGHIVRRGGSRAAATAARGTMTPAPTARATDDEQNLWQDYGTKQPDDPKLSCYQADESDHWLCAEDTKLAIKDDEPHEDDSY